MKTVYKCEKCGMMFDDYDEAFKHEAMHYEQKTWFNSEDEKVASRELEYVPELYAPSAVVVPLTRSFYDEDKGEYITEVIYCKYYYKAKVAEQVFPIDESVMK